MKLTELIQLYTLDRSFELSANSLTLYQTVFNRFVQHVGDKDITSLTASDFKGYLSSQESLSARSKNTHFQALHSLFTYCLDESYSDNHLMAKVKAPKFHPVQPSPLLADEIKRVLEYTKGKKRLDAICKIALDTGMRLQEIVNLDYSSVDFKTGRINVMGKGNKPRVVYAGKKALKAILIYRMTIDAGIIPLFVTRQGKRLHKTEVQRSIAVMSKDLQMHIHFHLFRHSYSYNAIQQGMTIAQLSNVLGHSDQKTTLDYVKFLTSEVSTMVNYSPLDNL